MYEQYGGPEASDARRLRQLDEENRRLKQIMADLPLDNEALKVVLGKASDAHGWELTV